MSYLVLARKYRPQTFDEVVQQDHISRTLTNAISAGRVAHAILFSGPRGTGKTTIARILAKAMNCKEGPTRVPCNVCRSCTEITSGNAVDVYEIDGASNNSVDQIRDLRDNVKYMPAHSLYKIYIIDEVHMLSIAAFNALLKTLEEPPGHVMFIFATTEPQKIPITILSRCQQHDLRRIDVASITDHLGMICQKEGCDMAGESLTLIAREAGGSMRDALSLLDQVLACVDDSVTDDQVIDILGVVDRKTIFDFSNALINGNVPDMLELVDVVYGRGHDLKKLYGDLIEHFRNLLVTKLGKNVGKLVDLPAGEIERMQVQVADVSPVFLNQVFDLLFREEKTIRFSGQPRLALEMVCLKLMQISPALPIDMLIEKLDRLRLEIAGEPGSVVKKALPVQAVREPARPVAGDAIKIPKKKAAAAPQPEDRPAHPESAWERLVAAVSKKHPALGPTLAKGTLEKMSDDKMVITVEGNGFAANMINKNMAAIKAICRDLFEKDMNVELSVVQNQNNDKIKKKKEESRAKQDALSHPLVADALEIFDGKIVDVKMVGK